MSGFGINPRPLILYCLKVPYQPLPPPPPPPPPEKPPPPKPELVPGADIVVSDIKLLEIFSANEL